MPLPRKDKVYLVLLSLVLIGCAVVYGFGRAELSKQRATYEQDLVEAGHRCDDRVERQLESTLSSFVSTVAYAAGALHAPEDATELHAMFDRLVLSPEIELLVAADATGTVAASTNRNLIGKPLIQAFGETLPGDEQKITKTDSGWRALSPFGGTTSQAGAVGIVFTTAPEQP